MKVNRQNAERREANWSGRGTAMLDFMETAQEFKRPERAYSTNNQLTIAKRLAILSAKYPDNNFYKSLVEQSKKYPLSPNQIRCIAKDYGTAFKRGKNYV